MNLKDCFKVFCIQLQTITIIINARCAYLHFIDLIEHFEIVVRGDLNFVSSNDGEQIFKTDTDHLDYYKIHSYAFMQKSTIIF